ncbi:hypothetical protein ACVILL_002603 [Bradyrhizobium sp. USDA 3364]
MAAAWRSNRLRHTAAKWIIGMIEHARQTRYAAFALVPRGRPARARPP